MAGAANASRWQNTISRPYQASAMESTHAMPEVPRMMSESERAEIMRCSRSGVVETRNAAPVDEMKMQTVAGTETESTDNL